MPFTLGKMGAGSGDARGDVNVFYIGGFERASGIVVAEGGGSLLTVWTASGNALRGPMNSGAIDTLRL